MKRFALLAFFVLPIWSQTPAVSELSAFFPGGGINGNSHRLEFAANRTKTLEVEGDWFSTNTRVQLFRGYGSNGAVSGIVQEWQILLTGRTEFGEIAVRLVSFPFAKCLDALASIAGSLAIQPCNTSAGQIWVLRRDPATGGFWIISYFYGLALQASSWNDGAAMLLTPVSNEPLQKFRMMNLGRLSLLESFSLFEFQDYQIFSRAFPARSVAASWYNNGASVVTKSPSPGCYDRWRLAAYDTYNEYGATSSRSSVLALFSLRPGSFDYCRPGAAAEIGYSYMGSPNMPITMWSFYRGVNQGWQVIPSRNTGYAHIVNTVSGMVLQANGNAEWTVITQAPFTGAPNQEFIFSAQSMFP
ncbi:MAG: hypothetical protein FJW36_08730 [Acidobacteria bacterium]|nr:hypothetical protein [Acidobacteriota bacterium]